MAPTPQRGELWLAEIPGDKRRPVLILTRASFIARLTNVTVAPVTTTIRRIPTELVVDERHGIDHDSAVNFDNLLTLRLTYLVRRLGALSTDELHEACDAIALALGCD